MTETMTLRLAATLAMATPLDAETLSEMCHSPTFADLWYNAHH